VDKKLFVADSVEGTKHAVMFSIYFINSTNYEQMQHTYFPT
jgi:hypothetical protein